MNIKPFILCSKNILKCNCGFCVLTRKKQINAFKSANGEPSDFDSFGFNKLYALEVLNSYRRVIEDFYNED